MVRAVKTPQPWHLMMQTVVPVLGQIVGYCDNDKPPEERYPAKYVFSVGQNKWQKFQTEISYCRLYYQPGQYKAGNINPALVFWPFTFVKAKRKRSEERRVGKECRYR